MINRLFSRAGIVDQLSITCGIRLWLARAPISRSSSIGAVVGNPVRTKFPAQVQDIAFAAVAGSVGEPATTPWGFAGLAVIAKK